jgi:hypothetical protein
LIEAQQQVAGGEEWGFSDDWHNLVDFIGVFKEQWVRNVNLEDLHLTRNREGSLIKGRI